MLKGRGFTRSAILLAGLCGFATNVSAAVVITGHGLFADCDDAFTYREGPLIAMLDGAFANYDAEFEARIQETIAAFETYRSEAEAAYAAANAQQKKRMAVTVGKWALLEMLDGLLDTLPASITNAYTPNQIAVFEEVSSASNRLKGDVAAAMVTGNPPDTVLSDQAYGITLSILSRYGGPVGAFLASTGQLGVGLANDYWETQPIKDVAQDEIDIFLAGIEKMHSKSQADKIAEINAVKNQIDAACGN